MIKAMPNLIEVSTPTAKVLLDIIEDEHLETMDDAIQYLLAIRDSKEEK